MDRPSDDAEGRLKEYTKRYSQQTIRPLGWGVHGTVFLTHVFLTNVYTAVKVHGGKTAYLRERDVYFRLRHHGISEIRGCNVPELVNWDDELWVIEMKVVERPFVLDFAGSYLDRRPDFTEEVLAEWREEKQDQFGADWNEVELILATLERYGIYLSDISPNNISFGPVD
jgi:hypothetical protein